MKDIYLDNQATTRTDPRVVERMLPYFTEHYGNPHSAQHEFGHDAKRAVDEARTQVAKLIGARPAEVVFTSGATEANNQALLGVARAHTGERRRLITTRIEHPCVEACMRQLEMEGFEVVYVPVDADGRVDLQTLAKLVHQQTLVVSIMAANNEIGVLQDLHVIGEICAAEGAFFHTDAAQAAAKIPVDVDAMRIDMLGISGHKLYAPMGSGAMFVRDRPDLVLAPLLIGGGQEFGLRSGTVAAPLAVGLGAACAIGNEELVAEMQRLTAMRETLWAALHKSVQGIRLVGHPSKRLPGNLNVCLPGTRAVDVIAALDGVALSSASACATGGGVPSHVLDGIGLAPEVAECCLRIGLGRFTTADEMSIATPKIIAAFAAAGASITA